MLVNVSPDLTIYDELVVLGAGVVVPPDVEPPLIVNAWFT